MRAIGRQWVFFVVLFLTACGEPLENSQGHTSPTVQADVPAPASSASPAALATAVDPPQPANNVNSGKADESIRAIGIHSEGRLLVVPKGQAMAAPLGAPSCYGTEQDTQWSGEYELVWELKSGGAVTKVMTFPDDFSIVQPNVTPVSMQHFTLAHTDIFAYTPRYTDCHGLETYFFGVSNGEAFPISLEMRPDRTQAHISRLPYGNMQITDDEIMITGGYAAGVEFIDRYHFRYDPKQKSMILNKTEQVSPAEIL